MEFRTVKSRIEKGELDPVYFFYGDEPYLINDLVRTVLEKGTDPSTRDFNCDVLQGENVDGDAVVAVASSFPMMAERRVVVVKSVQRLSQKGKNRLSAYLENPLTSTVLVLTANRVDLRQSFYAGLKKRSQWVECDPLYENQAVPWVQQKFREKGIQISHRGALFLVGQAGTSLWSLRNEADKVMTYAWGRTSLELEDVMDVVGMSRKYNLWEYTDAVARKDVRTAYVILNHLMDEGQSPVGLIMNLGQRMILLLRIRTLMDKGISHQAISSQLKMRPYFAKLYFEQISRYTRQELVRHIRTLMMADRAVKTGYMAPSMLMHVVTYELAGGKSESRIFA